ncbi:MAG TPA: filamentous hemagglutinin N-terminal domain-containing protein, partial [Gammaproteobacteria bacterium]|nr:filamentous hemagglutinin N-terminal domain-containing protein [Gammaproteobacteria bacterium]
TIAGTINSEIAGANLWLINPEGIVFGDGASVNVQGSLLVSSADYVLLSDGIPFYADVKHTDILSASPPEAFGFLSESFPAVARIGIGNVQISVPENKSISLLGSDVSVKGALLSAPGGSVSVVSINEAGEVIYSDQGQGLDVSSFEAFGPVAIDSTSFKIDGEQKGLLQIKGGDLEFSSSDDDFVSSVTQLKTSFDEEHNLMDKPCELADFYNQGKMIFTVDQDAEETAYGVKTKKTHRGPIGGIEAVECL